VPGKVVVGGGIALPLTAEHVDDGAVTNGVGDIADLCHRRPLVDPVS
jgi:hypothetical protein